MEKENQRSWFRTHQNQASFIASRGWKSSYCSPLPVEGEIFFLTFPFIEQAISPKTPGSGVSECNGDLDEAAVAADAAACLYPGRWGGERVEIRLGHRKGGLHDPTSAKNAGRTPATSLLVSYRK